MKVGRNFLRESLGENTSTNLWWQGTGGGGDEGTWIQKKLIPSRIKNRIPDTDVEVEALPSRPKTS
jgi:hypothetical protein